MEVPQGVRHQSLLTLAGAMRRVGMDTEEMMASLAVVRDNRFESGDHVVTDDEIADVVDWVNQKKRAYALTDLGNAERFEELFGCRVRFCYEWETWLVWDGCRWVVNAVAELMQMAHGTVRSIFFEAAHALDEDKRKAITKHAISSEARSKVENMLESAKPYLAVLNRINSINTPCC